MEQVKEVAGFKLYYQGQWDEKLFDKCIGIVGSRRMTSYGQRVVEKIVPRLVHDGWTIVSGMMYGVDIAAHRMCLANGGRTIGVLGWGIDCKLEDGDNKLAEEIVKSGLLLSLWKDQKATLWTFPARNKVVASISHELIVIEAGEKSGSLITANMALSLGKTVWAVPGPITSSVSLGTNRLIAEGKARMYLGESERVEERESKSVSNNPILDLIRNEAMDASEIARKLNQNISLVGSELTMMVLRGEIEEKNGKFVGLL